MDPKTAPVAHADELAPGEVHAGFVVEAAEEVPEVDGWAYVLTHRATGARLLWLANADENRAFSIAFKTPPADDTGVFHILEHSVLDGSAKYPVKEPFVNLLKSSMQTFLNAMTFPDKTMYPVASTNVADLENLMDVYLDAVLDPNIYRRPRIFEQEGWHYELESPDAPLTINGVVFNEMKGALSDPEDVLFMELKRQLFPDTCYRHESGGNPDAIPDLCYEEFVDAHRRHYRLDNSHTVLYGDLDIDRELAFLDERFSAAEVRGEEGPNELALQEPVAPAPLEVPLATAPDNRCVGLGYVIGTWADRERVLAADILLDALMGSNEAPLMRRIIDAGLGDDACAFVVDGMAQPMAVFELKGAKPGVAEEFRALVEGACAELADTGVPTDRLQASLAQAEFNLREGDFGYPDGVALAVCAMGSWLYDEDDPLSYVRYEDACRDLGDSMGLGIFDRLLREAVAENPHSALVCVEPQEGTGTAREAEHLARIKEAMDTAWLESVVEEARALKEEQQRPDDPADVAKLPHLTLADIAEAPAPVTSHEVEAPYPCHVYDLDTHRIDYTYAYFDLERLAWPELPYAQVLACLLGKLDTRRHTAAELDCLLESTLGDFSTFIETYGDADDPLGVARPKFVVGAASLSEKVDGLASLPMEVCLETLFEDTERIRAILTQRRVAMEQGFIGSGHSAALARCRSYYSRGALVADAVSGIGFYRFLVSLLDSFDRRAASLCEVLRNLQGRIFKGDGLETSFAGAPGDVVRYWEAAGDLGLMNDGHATKAQLEVPEPKPAREAFTIPANVCFVGRAAAGLTLPRDPVAYNGSWLVASRALSYGYLWNEVRVLGGAYGAGFNGTPASVMGFYSYRDPAVDPTLAAYAGAGAWLSGWDPAASDLEGFVISTVAGLDAPVKPRAAMRREDKLRISGRDPAWRAQIRREVLDSTVDAVRALGAAVAQVGEDGGVCVIGGADIIAASTAELEVSRLV